MTNLALKGHKGKETGELALLRALFGILAPGDIAMADRDYCSFIMNALMFGQPTASTSWYEAAKFCNWLTTGSANSGVYNTSTWAIMDRQTAIATFGTAYFIPTEKAKKRQRGQASLLWPDGRTIRVFPIVFPVAGSLQGIVCQLQNNQHNATNTTHRNGVHIDRCFSGLQETTATR